MNFYRQPSDSEKRKPADLLERGLIAVFLLRCLERAKFFENAEFLLDDTNTTIDDVKDYVGGLLLRHLQSVAITAFSINELQVNRFCVFTPVCHSVHRGGGVPFLKFSTCPSRQLN